jgi:hypothetical protein
MARRHKGFAVRSSLVRLFTGNSIVGNLDLGTDLILNGSGTEPCPDNRSEMCPARLYRYGLKDGCIDRVNPNQHGGAYRIGAGVDD